MDFNLSDSLFNASVAQSSYIHNGDFLLGLLCIIALGVWFSNVFLLFNLFLFWRGK